ncbi:MAG: type IX secretion system membrane protein PorP/SprF, partial [Cytophagaceae bacterium]|nr:type IX secretion system membrane protein PorP/SprF [Cytophagaceae bacterium]
IYDMILVGFWYRGIPMKKYLPRVQNNESMIFLVGWKIKEISITYSYDYILSKLRSSGTGGAHELNLTWYYYKPHKSKKPMKRLPCPQFYKHN